jgi:DHA1 family bicyclomycin/chloramphenicol resistance-like MFS transporter
VQLTLSIFMIAFAVSQLVYGPISDQFGRRPVLLGGMSLYLVACIGCAMASSIETLIFARFLQALGACSGPVVARAIVRDVFGRERSAKVMAYMGTAMALAPVLGPIAGGFLQVWFGWQANFAVMAALGGLSLVGVLLLLRETNINRDAGAAKPSRVLRNYGGLARDRGYIGYVLCSAFAFCGLFSFISASSFVFIGLLGLAPNIYGMCFAAVAGGFMVGTFFAGRLTTRLGIDPLVRIGTAVTMAAGSLMIVLMWVGFLSVGSILIPMIAFMVGFGLLHPNAMAGAIGPHASRAGAASALLGFVQLGSAALVGVAVGHTLGNSAMPMVLAIFLSGVACFTAYMSLVRPASQRLPIEGPPTSEAQEGP